LSASESTIADVNVGDAMLKDRTTTSAKFAKVQTPYKKQSAVAPAGATTISGCILTASESTILDVMWVMLCWRMEQPHQKNLPNYKNPYKKQSVVTPAGVTTKSGGILSAGESTIANINMGDATLKDAPALSSRTGTSDIAVLNAATIVTRSSVTPSTLCVTGVMTLPVCIILILYVITPCVTYVCIIIFLLFILLFCSISFNIII
jgi:hypothetical protein